MHIVAILLLVILLVGIIFLPQYWLSHTLRKYHSPEDKFPGTGGEFAQHLVKALKLEGMRVESTEQGDHYDPTEKAVRLSPDNFNKRSLTAIVVAAHEVGHAIQHQSHYGLFRLRTLLAYAALFAEKAGIILIMIMPVISLLTRSPAAALISTIAAIGLMALGVIVHLITLPVEWDASFNRALPVLRAGQYIDEKDYPAARRILRAAALTYVAGALASLLNLSRWIAILRR